MKHAELWVLVWKNIAKLSTRAKEILDGQQGQSCLMILMS